MDRRHDCVDDFLDGCVPAVNDNVCFSVGRVALNHQFLDYGSGVTVFEERPIGVVRNTLDDGVQISAQPN
jgi:hypothetical protein